MLLGPSSQRAPAAAAGACSSRLTGWSSPLGRRRAATAAAVGLVDSTAGAAGGCCAACSCRSSSRANRAGGRGKGPSRRDSNAQEVRGPNAAAGGPAAPSTRGRWRITRTIAAAQGRKPLVGAFVAEGCSGEMAGWCKGQGSGLGLAERVCGAKEWRAFGWVVEHSGESNSSHVFWSTAGPLPEPQRKVLFLTCTVGQIRHGWPFCYVLLNHGASASA